MSKITLIAKLTAAEGKAEGLAGALKDLCEAAEEETGLEIYSAHQAQDDPNTFYFFEMYTDGEALAIHGKGDAMKVAMAASAEFLGGRPEVTLLNPVAAKGLDI